EPVPALVPADAAAPPFAAAVARRFAADRWAVVALAFLALLALAALAAPWLAARVLHQSAFQQHMMDRVRVGGRWVDVVSGDGLPLGPNPRFPLGADLIGRDVLARILYGARVSLTVAGLGTALAMALGLAVGLLTGFYRGVVDTLLSRFVDAMMAIPVLLLAIALASVLRQGSVAVVVLVLGLVNWTYLARIIRAEVLSLRERDFVEAARALGASDAQILVRHLLPNLVGPLIVFATLSLAGNILLESALSFLGVGIQPPVPSWGNMIEEGMGFYQVAWWITLFPGLAILLTVVSLNLVGDGLRDALSPGARERGGA
ncbi:MAG TPA: ABC transporter permease, partial [Candidatus Eisenbacteria bacterium]|nr:ABC transporter permease [Candidatus Eisenbacteria bacterium]